MNSENTDSKPAAVTKVVYRLLGGAAVGALVVALPISYGSSIDSNLVRVGIATATILACGLLSIVWGEKFIDAVMRSLNNTGL